MNYGRALKKLREKRNLKQKELAEKAALDASYVSQIENGKRVPSTAAVEAIAKALDVPLYLLMLFASDAEDLRGISEEQARRLENQFLDLVMKAEQGD
ncbi:helix-turn-helix domain-containing protein [Hyalangium minutum]|uniref:helix-turn-helix domain-containing protein n=1 Tax=Hyalangium minutum TaxID=394096 RepID=UPI00094AB8A2|nr:helix-turn-helix transcriptional regulator [Hyalangium minutum]